MDIKIQTEILNLKDINCEETIKKNIEFANKVYDEAKILDQYEGASRIKNTLFQYHKKYDLLRALLWLNSIKIKERCWGDFHTIVYLYDYQSEDLEQKSKQAVFSNFLADLKDEFGDNIILIPIAKNLGISSLDLLIKDYGINETSIILDEKVVVSNPSNLYEIENRIRNPKRPSGKKYARRTKTKDNISALFCWSSLFVIASLQADTSRVSSQSSMLFVEKAATR